MNRVHPKNINQEDISLTVYADNTYMDENKVSTIKDEIENINDGIYNVYSARDNGVLSSGIDLNTLYTYDNIGYYALPGNYTYANKPSDTIWGLLRVTMIYNGGWTLQEFFSNTRYFTRMRANSVWSEWTEH